MLTPIACVLLRWMRPIVWLTSSKYSRGFTRTRAPVGQFSSQEYAAVFAFGGFSPVSLQRLHFTASRFSVCVTGSGIAPSRSENADKTDAVWPLPFAPPG